MPLAYINNDSLRTYNSYTYKNETRHSFYSISSSFLTIDNNNTLIGDIASLSNDNVSFNAYVESDVPLGEIATIIVELTNGLYFDIDTFYLELNPPTRTMPT